MSDPFSLGQTDFEILATRELRKAGLEIGRVRVRERRPLDGGEGEWAILLEAEMRLGGTARRLFIDCRRERAAAPDAVRSLAERLEHGGAEHGVIISTAGFDGRTVGAARRLGIALLVVADGRAAFLRSGWSTGGNVPAWVPEFMAEVVDLGPAGDQRRRLVTAGQPRLILDCLEGGAARGPDR